ncbi:2Fe-2S iron-sulfur cluster binding domain-containing protein [Rhodococcus fascians]|nr:2Fe-2S iron-sulfur cluster binding domain-containing protein [Rhodococcus fascians]MBY4140955.1 2Fe-2S iron-sulfur cluster binding domain-containing protein [Rhodococcus fascians]MBY4219619.1 2Fe-2S iron-sulfur cluster binding domain-containing protein [Rhodococcus fascians]MBY4221928.1 2Fe-2S iron-sulfur cluster binding domain-containing protein [Rhodococcus fascians]MBY4233929.1 2Fe-2S iron-sulfur cluster binding domain-containing protein [Rhodococcus fascians]
MTVVRIDGSDVEIDVRKGESVAEAAWRLGFDWPTKCWGQLECMQCFVRIKDREENIVPPEDEELFAMRTMFPPRLRSRMVRLGCRLEVCGDGVVLEKKGVRPPLPATQPEADEPEAEQNSA